MMKVFKVGLAVSAVTILIAGPSAFAQMNSAKMECKCHSKKPAMKHMHEAIGFSGCGNCHTKNENLMSGRNAVDPNRKATLSKRIREDKFCIPCHDSQGGVKKEILAGRKSLDISNTLFCPKDKLRFPSGLGSCPKCGGNLLNINAVMEKSRQNPSNEICIECHGMDEAPQIRRHAIFNATKLRQCLDCHQGHEDCASCHH